MALTPGQTLQDRYRITGMLGHGGMGAVYRAWDTRLGIAVALKAMTPEPGLDAALLHQAREQFHQEASVLSLLKHPNLVRVSDFFDEGGSTYLVMEFVEGESLADYIERAGTVSEDLALSWADQLLDALEYCHGEGVIHRDIKPQNVILTTGGQLVLVDFGLVKVWDPENPSTRTVIRSMGTPQYAPPEQYAPEMGHTDLRSDLYSLGATLYHALTGQLPPPATTRIASPGTLVPIKEFAPQVSAAVAQAIERAMALQPDARFANAAEMRSALRRTHRGPARVAPTAVLPGTEATTAQRRPKWGYVAATVGVLLICAAAGAAVVAGYRWLSDGGRPAVSLPLPTATGAAAIHTSLTPTATSFTQIADVEGTTPSPSPSPTPTREATPTLRPSSTTAPTLTDTPTPSPSPTPTCPPVTGPFAGVWQAHQDELGCARAAAASTWIAQEHFERGMMTWREDTDRIYVHYQNGAWASYEDIWQEGDPEFTCGTPPSPPTPVRGFGKIWCTYDAVRSGLGAATDAEVGQTGRVQAFDDGFVLQSQFGDNYVFLNSGRWWVE